MSVIYVLISVSLLVALGFLGFFLWAVLTGQFEDLYGNAHRILFDSPKKDNE